MLLHSAHLFFLTYQLLFETCFLGVFLVHISYTRTEYSDLQSKSPYSVRTRKNMDQKNSEYERFLCGELFKDFIV